MAITSENGLYVVPDPEPFRREGMGYVYEPPGRGVRLAVDFLHRRSDGLYGELLVECTMPGVTPHLHQANFTLTSTSTRVSMAKYLATLTKGALVNEQRGEENETDLWGRLLEQFCVAVLRREREGEPFERIGRLPVTADPPDLIDKVIPSGATTLLYGPGGVGKGWLATFIAVCVTTGTAMAGLDVVRGSVLYLDWEDNREILDRRVKRVSAGLGLPEPAEIHYRRCGVPLREQVHRVAEYIAQMGITAIVFDSVEAGSGSASENAPYDQRADAYFQAIRNICTTVAHPVSAICIDHVSEAARQNKTEVSKPYGALLKANRSRCAWEVRNDQDGKVTHLGLYQFKANHSEGRGPLGFKLDFSTPGMVYLDQEDVRGSPELSRRLPQQDQVAGALMAGGHVEVLAAKEIAEITGLDTNTVRAVLSRYKDRFAKTTDDRWTIRDDRRERAAGAVAPVRLVTTDSGEEIPF